DRVFLDSVFRVDDYDKNGIFYTGQAKFSFNAFDSATMHLGLARAIRIPSFTELYYKDPLTEGNPGLSPEKSLTYEAGVAYKNEKLSLSSLIFLRDEDNFVDWVEVEANKWKAKNIASAKVFGIEENIRYAFNSLFALSANYAYTNRNRNDRGYIYKYGENYARHLSSIISLFRFGFGVQELGITYKKTPSRSGWLLAHAKLSYNLNKNARIFISATNIFNVEYQEIEGIPSPGRWVEGGVRIEW
ncbi:MAG: TonB-dependent receptor, partial [Candidatus Omnitrophica bacterium]|nr:TonB-dependent receptor [Candidatus Omnitrophota bacterium]